MALGITHVTDVKSRLKKDGVATTEVIDNLGRTQRAIFINESNLYKTIFQSRKPSAEKFTDWVTSEVLPTIRKTGTYSIQKKETLQGKELLALAVLEAQKVIEEQTLQIEEMKPKADYHDEVLNKKKLISTTIIAKDLGFTSAIMLNRYLHDKGIIYKSQSGIWCPYSKYEWLIEEGYADYQSCNIEGSLPTLKWTEKGRKWIVELLQKRAVL
nr:MAG TPA: repressor domain protein [Caudoviricetes sp.]